MTETIDQLLDRARAAPVNDRIDMRDEIAARGPEAIEALGEWLADPDLCRFAVRVIGKAADLGARDEAVTTLVEARTETTPRQRADIDQELARLGINVAKKAPRRAARGRAPAPSAMKAALYDVAQRADPDRAGIQSELLWLEIKDRPIAVGRDASSVANILNTAHDLFERVPDVPSTFRWREDARPVHQVGDGALSGRRLAVVAHLHARRLDPSARGLNYQQLTGSIIESGELIAGVDWGAGVNKAVSGAEDLFERVDRGEYRWRHVPIITSHGWMMRTNRYIAAWIGIEAEAGRLRQGWGSHPGGDLGILRDRRNSGEPFDPDDDLAWANRRMLTDEPDGIGIGDVILAPHVPREWRWSVFRVIGPYRYEVDDGRRDYGHILPVAAVAFDIDPNADPFVRESLREAARYPARLMRMSDEQTDDLHRLVAD